MPRPSSKEAILDAAEAIVIESGASHMTLDAVAERSGVSKGGLIYNFPCKDDLLKAMVGRMQARIERMREKARQELPAKRTNELMVEIRSLQRRTQKDQRLSAALLAVLSNQPELLRPLSEQLRERFRKQLTTRGDFERSAILYFAAMGLHFHELLQLSLIDSKQRMQVFDELIRLAGNAEKKSNRL